ALRRSNPLGQVVRGPRLHAYDAAPLSVNIVRPFGQCGSPATIGVIDTDDPAAPAGPIGPCAPVGPVAPCNPVGPVEPSAPAAPVGRNAPVAPVGPCAPVAPVAPWTPVAPVGPR